MHNKTHCLTHTHTHTKYLRYYDISQSLRAHEQLIGSLILQRLLVVLKVILDAVVDVRYLADLKVAVLQLEVFFQLGPAPDQQLP